MAASVELHRMGFTRWLRVIAVKERDDWTIISENLQIISEIKCSDNTLLDPRNQQVLSELPHLCSATIDAHSDVWHDDRDRFAYRDIVTALPPSLKRLEITHAHGPDIKIIATVKKHCPQLEEFRLGRCTMFNRIPACDFWESFPHDHDAYISDIGTDAYAHSLGHELSPLKNLRSLRMGLYLVPAHIILAHRLYHKRGRTAPAIINWQTAIPLSELPLDPFIGEPEHVEPATTDQLVSVLHQHDSERNEPFDCPQCVEATAEVSRSAEMSANTILQSHIPSLTKVEWMGWLTPGHLGMHSFELPLKSGL